MLDFLYQIRGNQKWTSAAVSSSAQSLFLHFETFIHQVFTFRRFGLSAPDILFTQPLGGFSTQAELLMEIWSFDKLGKCQTLFLCFFFLLWAVIYVHSGQKRKMCLCVSQLRNIQREWAVCVYSGSTASCIIDFWWDEWLNNQTAFLKPSCFTSSEDKRPISPDQFHSALQPRAKAGRHPDSPSTCLQTRQST